MIQIHLINRKSGTKMLWTNVAGCQHVAMDIVHTTTPLCELILCFSHVIPKMFHIKKEKNTFCLVEFQTLV